MALSWRCRLTDAGGISALFPVAELIGHIAAQVAADRAGIRTASQDSRCVQLNDVS